MPKTRCSTACRSRAGAQEAGELVLRQQDGLGELVAAQPTARWIFAAHLVDVGGDRLDAAAAAGGVGDDPSISRGEPILHSTAFAFLGGAGAAHLGALEPGLAPHPVEPGGGLEHEVDHARLGGRGVLGADPVRAGGGAGDLPVQGVDDRVEDRDLPEPVGPSSRNIPPAPRAAKSMLTVPAKGPMPVRRRWCSFMRPPAPGGRRCRRGPARRTPRRWGPRR